MHLADLGWDKFFQNHFAMNAIPGSLPARVTEQNHDIYRVLSEKKEYLSRVSGRVRFYANDQSDFPAVGDWVLITPADASQATIHAIFPRKTLLSRKMPGKSSAEQILAANIDVVFIVTSMNQDFNLRRLERYLSLVWESGARPVVLVNKADLTSDPEAFVLETEQICPGVSVHAISALTGGGMQEVRAHLRKGRTIALIGSSGVGKSTIINALTGADSLRVQPVRIHDDRGKHTTTSRQLILLKDGGILIDSPGLRELQLWDDTGGFALVFTDLELLAEKCKFRNCSHSNEPDCAVLAAVEAGTFSNERLANFRKMKAELSFQKRKVDPISRQRYKTYAKRMSKSVNRHSHKRR